LIAAVAAAAYLTKISRVLLFWIAFVLTRPFGATFGDVLTRPVAEGGVGFGTKGSSLVLLTILVIGVLITLVRLRQQAALEPVLASSELPAGENDSGPASRSEW